MPNRVSDDDLERLFGASPTIHQLGVRACSLIRELVPDADEEIDRSPPMIAFTFAPGTYTGLVAAIVPQRDYVNIMLPKGVALLDSDPAELLEGSGKRARHIKVRDAGRLEDPAVHELIAKAASLTPR
jgi:hypothetical protein